MFESEVINLGCMGHYQRGVGGGSLGYNNRTIVSIMYREGSLGTVDIQ